MQASKDKPAPKGPKLEVLISDGPPVGARVRQASLELKLDEKPWRMNYSATGKAYYASTRNPGWVINGLPRPTDKRGLPQIKRPLGSLVVFPSVDPLKPRQRALFRALMTENSWIQRANVIIQKLVVTRSTTEVEPRLDQELDEDALEKWRKEEINVPLWGKKKTPTQIKKWMDQLAQKLDAASIWFNAELIMREQGRCVVGMFPEERGDGGDYVIPEALRYIEPEYTRRPVINYNTGELAAIEIVGLTSNGGRLDANRAIYLTNSDNLNLFARFYGRSMIEPLQDIGRTLLTIYSSDFPHAAEFTWHKPNIYKITIPARDWDKFEKIQDQFNAKLEDNAGKDISVTQAVELLNPGAGSNTGNITGLVQVQNECIDAIAGYYNIPPFIFAKGKAGRLGGNANREEIDAFLEIEIRPEQEILENNIEKQFYDRILAILFQVEPEDVENPEKVPIKIKHFFDKPKIAAAIDVEQYEIAKDMRDEGLIRTEDLMDQFNLRSDLNDETITGGEDVTPSIKTWVKTNRSWGRPQISKNLQAWKPKRIQVNTRPKWPVIPGAVVSSEEKGSKTEYSKMAI